MFNGKFSLIAAVTGGDGYTTLLLADEAGAPHYSRGLQSDFSEPAPVRVPPGVTLAPPAALVSNVNGFMELFVGDGAGKIVYLRSDDDGESWGKVG